MTATPVHDDLWAAVEPLLPPSLPCARGGRPPAPDRAALPGILFVLRTGAPWRSVPLAPGCSGVTCWRRLRDWQAAGVQRRLHRVLLELLHGVLPAGPRSAHVERTLAWLSRFRRLAIRYERNADIHLALTTLACAVICLKRAKRF